MKGGCGMKAKFTIITSTGKTGTRGGRKTG
jgi:hypothetical protein